MAATIKIKNSSTAGAAPTSSDLVQGELAVNVTDKRLYTENASGTIVELGTNPSVPVTFPDGSASAPSLTNDGDTNTGLFFPAADTVGIATGGSERARVDSSGNLGLGVTPSAWYGNMKAVQFSDTASYISSYTSGITSYQHMFLGNNGYMDSSGNWIYSKSRPAAQYYQENNTHKWLIAASGTAGNAITFTQAMTLDASGNLGVGTTSPSRKFHVVGSGVFSDGTNDVTLWNDGSVGTNANIALKFNTNGTERARIDSSGNLLVGTTSATRTGQSQVKSTSTSSALRVETTGATVAAGVLEVVASGAPANTSNYLITATTSGADRLYIYSNGNVVNSNNSYGALSDIKLKENITDATPKLAGLMQVRVVNYNLKSDPEHKQLGVVAQELEQVFPAMIDESPDYEQITTIDEDGNETTERVATGTTTKSVKYSVFVPMLIKAIQELKEEFDAYKAAHP